MIQHKNLPGSTKKILIIILYDGYDFYYKLSLRLLNSKKKILFILFLILKNNIF